MNVGWRVTERFGDGETRSAAEINEAILDAFVNGASGLWLAVGDGVSAGDLAEVFTGVYLDLIPVTLDAGTDAVAASRAYLELRRTAQEAPVAARPTAATTGSLGLSPLTAAFAGRPRSPPQRPPDLPANSSTRDRRSGPSGSTVPTSPPPVPTTACSWP